MILGPVSYLDCIVFCAFLAPQLIWHVGPVSTVLEVLRMLPFLLIQLPLGFLYERFVVPRRRRSPFVRTASPFEDFVIRCVRYAFANLPPRIGRVFFSRSVALPFLRFRMLRHGYWGSPYHCREYQDEYIKGVWVIKDPSKKPDLVIYYAHGGGFSMGSSYFYLEFLMTWLSVLMTSTNAYENPAIFSLEYTLVPDASFPAQFHQAVLGYQHVLGITEPERVCFSGDSAGAGLILSLLLSLSDERDTHLRLPGCHRKLLLPGLALLISPWVKLVSPRHRNTESDYVNVKSLHEYGLQYAGGNISTDNWLVSPGSCRSVERWTRAVPKGGVFITYGQEEVFAPEIEDLARFLQKAGLNAGSREEVGGIHAWPVASLFLSGSEKKRLEGLRVLVDQIIKRVPPVKGGGKTGRTVVEDTKSLAN